MSKPFFHPPKLPCVFLLSWQSVLMVACVHVCMLSKMSSTFSLVQSHLLQLSKQICLPSVRQHHAADRADERPLSSPVFRQPWNSKHNVCPEEYRQCFWQQNTAEMYSRAAYSEVLCLKWAKSVCEHVTIWRSQREVVVVKTHTSSFILVTHTACWNSLFIPC